EVAPSANKTTHKIFCFKCIGRTLEHFHKYCSPAAGQRQASGLFGFGLRFGSVTGFSGTCAFAKASPKPKNPRSAWLQYFFKRTCGGIRARRAADNFFSGRP